MNWFTEMSRKKKLSKDLAKDKVLPTLANMRQNVNSEHFLLMYPQKGYKIDKIVRNEICIELATLTS